MEDFLRLAAVSIWASHTPVFILFLLLCKSCRFGVDRLNLGINLLNGKQNGHFGQLRLIQRELTARVSNSCGTAG